jgi:sodium-dependent dicarboxylate transporter 2/3/5
VKIGFLQWLAVGVPLVLVSIPLAWWILTRVAFPFALPELDRARLRVAIGPQAGWSSAERRLLPVLLSAAFAWIALPLLKIPALAGIEDSSVAILAALVLFVIPAGACAAVACARHAVGAWIRVARRGRTTARTAGAAPRASACR